MTWSNRAGDSYIVGHHIGDGSDVKLNKIGKKLKTTKLKTKKDECSQTFLLTCKQCNIVQGKLRLTYLEAESTPCIAEFFG